MLKILAEFQLCENLILSLHCLTQTVKKWHRPCKTTNNNKYLFGIICIFDFVMDIVILIIWYNEDKIIFFGIGISCIILSQLSYLCAVQLSHGATPKDMVQSCFLMLPFTSCLEIVWSFTTEPDSQLRKIIDNHRICCCVFDWNNNLHSQDFYEMDDWIQNLWNRNIVRFLHTILESFPQCTLQIVSIFYHK